MRNERTETIVVLSKRNFYIALVFMISLDLLIVNFIVASLGKQEPVQLPATNEVSVSSSSVSSTRVIQL